VIPASPAEIYNAWLDNIAHSEMTGGEAIMSDEVGAEVSAWDGYITGRILELVPGERIVQSWRTTEFDDEIEDSTGDDRVAKDFTPFGEAAIRGEDHGAALVAGIHEWEEQMGGTMRTMTTQARGGHASTLMARRLTKVGGFRRVPARKNWDDTNWISIPRLASRLYQLDYAHGLRAIVAVPLTGSSPAVTAVRPIQW
jgi:uncharacterized protein YndB with AHSA1/START domain